MLCWFKLKFYSFYWDLFGPASHSHTHKLSGSLYWSQNNTNNPLWYLRALQQFIVLVPVSGSLLTDNMRLCIGEIKWVTMMMMMMMGLSNIVLLLIMRFVCTPNMYNVPMVYILTLLHTMLLNAELIYCHQIYCV